MYAVAAHKDAGPKGERGGRLEAQPRLKLCKNEPCTAPGSVNSKIQRAVHVDLEHIFKLRQQANRPLLPPPPLDLSPLAPLALLALPPRHLGTPTRPPAAAAARRSVVTAAQTKSLSN